MKSSPLLVRFRRICRWIHRFRHRCGYGIHSPYAFEWVTGVIYEKEEYYAYPELRLLSLTSSLREKDVLLLFRIANHARANRVFLIDNQDEAVRCAYQMARTGSLLQDIPATSLTSPFLPEKADLIYVAHAEFSAPTSAKILALACSGGVIVVHGIHLSAQAQQFWEQLKTDERVRVTFDLYDFGIASLEARLAKENHIINYF